MTPIKDKILKAGIDNCMFLVPMRPVRTVFGLIAYTSSSDEEQIVPAKIDRSKYKIEENYKVSLKSIYQGFGTEHFYLSDLETLIKDGHVEFYVKRVIL